MYSQSLGYGGAKHDRWHHKLCDPLHMTTAVHGTVGHMGLRAISQASGAWQINAGVVRMTNLLDPSP